MDNVKYLTPKKPLSEIARERAEAAEQQISTSMRRSPDSLRIWRHSPKKTPLSQSVLLNLKEDNQNEN